MSTPSKVRVNIKANTNDKESALQVRFSKFWALLEKQLEGDNSELRELALLAMKDSGICDDSRIVLVTASTRVTNYNRFFKSQMSEMKDDENAPVVNKERRALISQKWKALSKEDKAKWSNDDGTGVYVPKVSKRHSNGYNLFTKEQYSAGIVEHQTSAQRFRAISEAWAALTVEQRESWNAKARAVAEANGFVPKVKKTGPKRLSGYNLYIREQSGSVHTDGKRVNFVELSGQWKALPVTDKDSWNTRARDLNLASGAIKEVPAVVPAVASQ